MKQILIIVNLFLLLGSSFFMRSHNTKVRGIALLTFTINALSIIVIDEGTFNKHKIKQNANFKDFGGKCSRSIIGKEHPKS